MTTPASHETTILKTVVTSTSAGPSGIGVLSAAQPFFGENKLSFVPPATRNSVPVVLPVALPIVSKTTCRPRVLFENNVQAQNPNRSTEWIWSANLGELAAARPG